MLQFDGKFHLVDVKIEVSNCTHVFWFNTHTSLACNHDQQLNLQFLYPASREK